MIPRVSSVSELLTLGIQRITIAIGVFDGVHAGHQQIIRSLVALAEETQSVPVVLTFNPHPREVLTDWNPKLLCSLERRLELLEYFGAKAVVTIPFTEDVAHYSPENFVRHILCVEGMHVVAVTVGSQWRFGEGAQGDVEVLKQLGNQFNFRVESVPEVFIDDEPVSSSRIRHAITDDDLNLAALMLNRPYNLRGRVVSGFGVASIDLDAPTANLQAENNVIPCSGVYATFALYNGTFYNSVTAIGVAPSFDHGLSEARVEVHLITDEEEYFDLLDQDLSIYFIAKIREELSFESADDLKIQIVDDIVEAKEALDVYDSTSLIP